MRISEMRIAFVRLYFLEYRPNGEYNQPKKHIHKSLHDMRLTTLYFRYISDTISLNNTRIEMGERNTMHTLLVFVYIYI